VLSCGKAKHPPLSGQLTVLVRPPDRTIEPISLDRPEALPVQSGGAMCLDVHLNEPAYIYLVWIDSAGQLVPLYPWNNERLETTDIDQPPPARRPSKLVFSPLLGKTWTFSDHPGAETVLLLASRTPVPPDLKISKLLRTPPPSAVERVTEVVEVQHQGLGKAKSPDATSSNRVTAGMLAKEIPLSDYLAPLDDYFDFIKAVQFSHAESSEQPPPDSR
jgi:hypothetical protein